MICSYDNIRLIDEGRVKASIFVSFLLNNPMSFSPWIRISFTVAWSSAVHEKFVLFLVFSVSFRILALRFLMKGRKLFIKSSIFSSCFTFFGGLLFCISKTLNVSGFIPSEFIRCPRYFTSFAKNVLFLKLIEMSYMFLLVCRLRRF